MISLLISLVVLGLIAYVVTLIPLADPFPQFIRLAFIVIAVVLIIRFLLVAVGHPATEL